MINEKTPIDFGHPQPASPLETQSSDINTAGSPEGKTAEKSKGWKGFLLETLQTLLLALILYFLIDSILGRVEVENVSMQPTLYESELLLVNKLAYRLGKYERGDIVIFHNPASPNEDYIKRVIGIPGDIVKVVDGNVSVNEQTLAEPYIASPPEYDGEWEVPPENIFVLGDNRNNSSDSHRWGYVPFKNVVGKAIVIYWPPKAIGLIRHSELVTSGVIQ